MKTSGKKVPTPSTRRKAAPSDKLTIKLDALPLDARLDMQSALASHIQERLEAQGVTEEEILADFEVSRKAHR